MNFDAMEHFANKLHMFQKRSAILLSGLQLRCIMNGELTCKQINSKKVNTIVQNIQLPVLSSILLPC